MENVVTDFIHANWTEEHAHEARQRCILDSGHVVENGASDAYSRMGDAVGNHLEVAKAFVNHVRELGYTAETNFLSDPNQEAFFNFRDKDGLVWR